MLFNSFGFIMFFLIVMALYFTLDFKYRWLLLLISSYYFYMSWNRIFIVLIIFSTLVDYSVALKMGETENKRERKNYLIVSLVVNLGLLFIFKYTLFFNESLSRAFSFFNVTYPIPTAFNIVLPMGISFYTFQTLSYTIDVYRGRIKPEKHLGIFALYVSFFPQLVAGPIERSDKLLPQFFEKHKFEFDRVLSGLKQVLLGFFKKVVIADRAAVVVNEIYNNPYNYEGLYFLIATFLFAFQIFCDFSGYSDIAIGTARILGINLMTNFKRPYFAKSIKDFWRRWHISLSTWFKDYLYIPLGGSRVAVPKFLFNVFITFLISGLWHGANWNFVIWGAIHGIYQIIGYLTIPIRKSIIKRLKINKNNFCFKVMQSGFTFVLVGFSWIFFRANTFTEAKFIINNFFNNWVLWFDLNYLYEILTNLGVTLWYIIVLVSAILLLIVIEWLSRIESLDKRLLKSNLVVRWSFYYMLLIIVITMGVFYDASEFIYFQF
ncbi:D-alanyl-lipoteichoic acid acyltransferase DltB (MBOAT superfamily) [Natranaerovirga pectinivora]|uniref:D-alanyl-lipoteichoic acid acyltransferase DltB (MBOAT superfamily) n=1 Tax=Natranaerovirga pectinivora TaxID=682400 RepID=A0A4R3MST6_9FIRM|nr:MBOAT family O-acyltransferase [Natranaerovirga pectinivora]TCT16770.1 D-alanyl-lipoteichoic acid acyltransferase DltB (MBOAT superfamily) [Natranaerovirga pectinivora]